MTALLHGQPWWYVAAFAAVCAIFAFFIGTALVAWVEGRRDARDRELWESLPGAVPLADTLKMKQGPSAGQVASAAPAVTDSEERTAGETGQGRWGLAAERNTSAPAPTSEPWDSFLPVELDAAITRRDRDRERWADRERGAA